MNNLINIKGIGNVGKYKGKLILDNGMIGNFVKVNYNYNINNNSIFSISFFSHLLNNRVDLICGSNYSKLAKFIKNNSAFNLITNVYNEQALIEEYDEMDAKNVYL